MNRPLALMTACVCAGAVTLLAAQYAPYEPEWNKPVKPHQIISNIYYVGTNELSSILITTKSGHILIDAGFDETVPLIRDSIRTLGFKYEDVKLLLNTQAHYDHAASFARLKRETGARLEAMGLDAPLLEAGGRDDFRFGNELTFPPVKVDRVLKDGDTVEQGGMKLLARLTAGHTKGATTYVTSAEERGKTYQVVFSTSISVNPGTSLVANPKYPTIVSDWEKTYALLKSLKPDVWTSTHAGFFDMSGKAVRAGQDPNPYIDPQGYRRFIEAGEARFRANLADQRAGKKP